MAAIFNVSRLVSRQAQPSLRGVCSRVFSFSASVRRSEDVQPLSIGEDNYQGFGEVGRILDLAGPKTQQTPADDFRSKDYNRGGQNRHHRTPAYNPFGHQLFVKPRDFTRAGRRVRRNQKKPFELGPPAARAKQADTFLQLQIDPVHEATNSTLMTHFLTKMGRIHSRAETGLSWRTQRKLGKAIRRARMMGIIPQLSNRKLRSHQA